MTKVPHHPPVTKALRVTTVAHFNQEEVSTYLLQQLTCNNKFYKIAEKGSSVTTRLQIFTLYLSYDEELHCQK